MSIDELKVGDWIRHQFGEKSLMSVILAIHDGKQKAFHVRNMIEETIYTAAQLEARYWVKIDRPVPEPQGFFKSLFS